MPSPFLDSVRRVIRTLHYSIRTEQSCLSWIRQFILFHHKRHPAEMGAIEVGAFPSYLANERHVSAAIQNQALNALNFLYTRVLDRPLGELQGVARAKRPKRLPVVLSRREVALQLDRLSGQYQLMARLMYGSGLRLMEVLRLRIKDVDFDRHAILVRAGKGDKDRITVLPDALARKYPGAAFQTGRQYVFPAANRARDPLSGRIKRHHIHHTSVQNAIKKAVRLAGIEKPASSHTLRHCFATHVLNRGGRGVRSPLDSR